MKEHKKDDLPEFRIRIQTERKEANCNRELQRRHGESVTGIRESLLRHPAVYATTAGSLVGGISTTLLNRFLSGNDSSDIAEEVAYRTTATFLTMIAIVYLNGMCGCKETKQNHR